MSYTEPVTTPIKRYAIAVTEKPCQCGRADCPGMFTGSSQQRVNPKCAKEKKLERARVRAARSRKEGTDTISRRKDPVNAYVPSNAGVKDGQTRKPSADWPERRERIRAMHGVKLPKKGEYTL